MKLARLNQSFLSEIPRRLMQDSTLSVNVFAVQPFFQMVYSNERNRKSRLGKKQVSKKTSWRRGEYIPGE